MPQRFCICTGCAACNGRTHTFDRDSTGTMRCPACQAAEDRRRNARGNTTRRGLGWEFVKAKRDDPAYQAATSCHWCGGPFTRDDPKTGDHLTPRSKGGQNGPIVAAHRSCNSRRGNRQKP